MVSLGYYDEGGDGFLTGHTVGIFDTTGLLLASTFLHAGTDGILDGNFRFQTINPITLSPGHAYVMAATTNGNLDPWAYGNESNTLSGFIVDPAITIASDAATFLYQSDNLLRFPTDAFGYTIYAGPNIQGNVIPEPTTTLLIGIPLLCLIIQRQRGTKR